MKREDRKFIFGLLAGCALGVIGAKVALYVHLYRAEQYIRQLYRENPNSALALGLLADQQIANGNFERGLQYLQQAIKLEPERIEPYFALISFHIKFRHDLSKCSYYVSRALEIAAARKEEHPEEFYMACQYEELFQMCSRSVQYAHPEENQE